MSSTRGLFSTDNIPSKKKVKPASSTLCCCKLGVNPLECMGSMNALDSFQSELLINLGFRCSLGAVSYPITIPSRIFATSVCLYGIRCPNTSRVILGFACPNRREATNTSIPLFNINDAAVCRRSWNLIAGRLAFLREPL